MPATPTEYEYLSTAVDDVGVALALLDEERRVRMANKTALALLGRRQEEVLGRCYEDLFDPAIAALVRDALERVFGSGEPLVLQEYYSQDAAHPEGLYLDLSVQPLRDAAGQVAGLLVATVDVSAGVRARRQVEAQHALLETVFAAASTGMVVYDTEMRVVRFNAEYARIIEQSGEPLVGRVIYEVVPSMEALRPLHRRVLAGESIDEWAVPFVLPGGESGYYDRRYRPLRGADGAIAGILGNFMDVTERVLAYRTLEQRVDERTRELLALLRVSNDVASTLELEPLLALILDRLKTLVDYTEAVIFAVEQDELVVLDYRGPGARDSRLRRRFGVEESAGYQHVVRGREAVIVDDLWGDNPQAGGFRASASSRMLDLLSHTHSWMGVPLIVKDRLIGMLRLGHEQPGFFTAHHAQMALAMANHVASAVENARLYGQAQELATLEERQRLARELHDSVSQALYGIGLGINAARATLDVDPAQAAAALDYTLGLTEAAVMEMRALIFELRPESLAAEGLVAALKKRVDAFSARHRIEVRAELGDEPRAPIEVKEALYRIAQEALNNTVKHARARHVELRLRSDPESLILELRDDGRGFDPARPFPGHLGLQSMRERAARLGGHVEITSAPGQGAAVLAEIPLSSSRAG